MLQTQGKESGAEFFAACTWRRLSLVTLPVTFTALQKAENKTKQEKTHHTDKYTTTSQQDVRDVTVEKAVGRVTLSVPSATLGKLVLAIHFFFLIDLVILWLLDKLKGVCQKKKVFNIKNYNLQPL